MQWKRQQRCSMTEICVNDKIHVKQTPHFDYHKPDEKLWSNFGDESPYTLLPCREPNSIRSRLSHAAPQIYILAIFI